jgi:Flp pilus assembly pilin Flp
MIGSTTPRFIQGRRSVAAANFGGLAEREEGQTNTEYALILFLVALTAAIVLINVGGKIKDVLASVNAAF